jgi:hypothetical protein
MCKKQLIILIYLAVLAFLPQAHTQIEDLTQDADFFQKQTEVYQRWLDNSGLGAYLNVYDIEVEKDMLSIYLSFPYTDLDSIQNAWLQVKQDFEADAAITLEEQLHYKASFIMELRQSMVNVQVYDTYDLRKEPLFMRAIYVEDGQVRVEKSNPKSERETIELKPTDLSKSKEESVASFQQRYSKQQVYDCVYRYAEERFKSTQCIERYPQVRLLEEDNNLVFEVSDLCREVLTDEANPTLCGVLQNFGYDCNWVKRELLRFTITHEATTEGFRLVILIDGKYGSGFYDKVKRGGYIDMEGDFDEYLEIYARSFKTELRRVLLNCK